MKTRNLFILGALLLGSLSFSSCSDDSKDSGDPYYAFDGNLETVNVSIDGITKTNMAPVTLRSNRDWTIRTSEEDSQWLHTYITEGEDDGIFYYWVDPNPAFTGRQGHIDVYSGNEKVKSLEIVQDASVPSLAILNAETGYVALPTAGNIQITVDANVKWKPSLNNVSWARIESVSEKMVTIAFDKNEDDKREVVLTCQGEGEFSNLVTKTTITQSAPGIILNERFDWLQEGKEDFLYNYPEVAFSKWNDTEKAMGWKTLGDAMYGGRGYAKIGKTNVAGDLVSPALSAIKGSANVIVTFQSIGYIATTGKKDDGVLSVGLMGPGTIEADKKATIDIAGSSYPVAVFDITVYPDSPKKEHGENYDPWKEAGSKFQFKIKGATSATQVVFIGGPKWGKDLKGTGQSKNRLYLDNIKIQEQL